MNNKTPALMGLLVIGLLAAPGVSAASESADPATGCITTYIADAKAAGSYNEHEAALLKFAACTVIIVPATGVSASAASSDEASPGCVTTYIADAKAAGSYNEHEAALLKFTACMAIIPQ